MRVRYTKLAIRDLEAVRSYTVARYGDEATQTFLIELRKIIHDLSLFPDAGRVGRVQHTRELAIPQKPFVIAYRVRGDEVHILAVMHTSRQWPERL